LQSVASEIERQTAQLFHLKAGLAKIQSEIDTLIGTLGTLAAAAGEATVDDLDEEEARRQIAEFDAFITSLEVAAEAPTAGEVAVSETPQLTQIKGIDAAASQALSEVGFSTFETLANATAADVAAIRDKLGPDCRISKDGWIEQAAMLAAGTKTHHLEAMDTVAATQTTAEPDASHSASSEVVDLFGRRRVIRDIITAASEGAAGIGRKTAIAASFVALVFGLQTTPIDFSSAFATAQIKNVAACSRAVLAGDATCAGVTWLRS
jgi:predicted flap endonuclease-1-like 5' DNA nuclease